jgi:exodeoxyribonuclease-1
MDVFKPYPPGTISDPDHMIYSGGFFSNQDRSQMDKIRNTDPDNLGQKNWSFTDPRLAEMLFRFRARNFPATLSSNENRLWHKQRRHRLNHPSDDRQLNPETFAQEISAARQTREGDTHAQTILDQLEAWANDIVRDE